VNTLERDTKKQNIDETAQSEIHEKILASARRLFSKKGFKASTTKMIAKEAAINEATLFRHFQNKENLLIQIINTSFIQKEDNSLSKCLAKDIHTIAEAEQMLVNFGIIFYTQYLVKNKEFIFINLFEMGGRPHIASTFSQNVNKIFGMLINKLQELQVQGVLEGSEYSEAAMIYIQSLIGTFIMKYRMQIDFIPLSPEDLCKKASKVLLYGIR